MSDGGDNSSLCDKLACFSLVISLGIYVHQQSCYSPWIYSKNLSLRFLEETEVYSSREPLATAFSWTSQHTALFYMLLSNTQQIHEHCLRPGTLQVMPGRRSSNTHLPLCPFSSSSHSGTSLNTFPTVLGVIFFKQWNHQHKVWERGQAWHYERHLHSMRTEIQKQEGSTSVMDVLWAQPSIQIHFPYKIKTTPTLKNVLFHFTSLSISGKCLCTSHVIVSVGFTI